MTRRLPAAVAALLLLGAPPAQAQERTETFLWEAASGEGLLEVAIHRPTGPAMLRVQDLEPLGAGWAVSGRELTLDWGAHRVELVADRPAALVDGRAVQLAIAPVSAPGGFYAPVQLFTDVLPDRAPDLVVSDGASWRAIVVDERALGDASPPEPADSPSFAAPTAVDGPRVVVIDPGHGGQDPGAVGPSGVREKDVALAVALRLAEVLRDDPDYEVHLTRRDDRLVPLWERGPAATELKGERPGLFISIHVNSVSDRRVRGFETYFLSEARTEHERRVAALENAAMAYGEREGTDLSADPELGFILNELRNFDHQHWSADLAAEMQARLDEVHPGNNRGVKQGPLAVITNSIMPSVLVELGFISNPDEEELLSSETFQRDSADALAEAVRDFFQRYPPGARSGGRPEPRP